MKNPTETPSWIKTLARSWNAGTHGVFVLSGNVHDLFPLQEENGHVGYGNLKTVLCQRVFPSRKMLFFFDISDGLTVATKEMQTTFMEWLEVYSSASGVAPVPPSKFVDAMKIMKAFSASRAAERSGDGKSGVTMVVDFAEKIIPSPSSSLSESERIAEVALLKFAATHEQKDAGIILITESPANLSETLAGNPYLAHVKIDMPETLEREAFLRSPALSEMLGENVGGPRHPMPADEIARRTAGLNLRRLFSLVAWARESRVELDAQYIARGKKQLIEEFCQGLVTFKEPDPMKTLDSVANHDAAKLKFKQIAYLVKEEKNAVLEKGVLLPGRIGVGKSYIVSCFASECGMPMLELGNFRSQWVGETEKQLSKILMTIRALGPVVVVIDEADAVLGNSRDGGSNDSGVGNRIFATLASHIGDDKMRGREIWIAMTSRPDLLAIDMKRQGRFGLCIPLFPSQNNEETKTLFEVVSKTKGVAIGPAEMDTVCEVFKSHPLTGSDAEAVVVRAMESAALEKRDVPSPRDFKDAIESFIDPLDPEMLRVQELSAVLACSDRRFLPESYKNADRAVLRKELDLLLGR